MEITRGTLADNKRALLEQQAQGLALYHQASGALQLVEALEAQLSDALTQEQLGDMLDAASV